MIFNTKDKALRYLDKCFVRAENTKQGINEIVYSVGGDKVVLHEYNRENRSIKERDLPSWNFYSPRLGYVHLKGLGTWYLQRNPIRSWKTGINSSNVDSRIFRDIDTFSVLDGLRKVHNNEYVDFTTALRMGYKAPFSQNYACHEGKILYQDVEVGKVNNGFVHCKSQVAADFHNRVIGSITGLTFVGKNQKAVDYDNEDF